LIRKMADDIHGLLIVIDITDEYSRSYVLNNMAELQLAFSKRKTMLPIGLLVNKSDKASNKRQISKKEAEVMLEALASNLKTTKTFYIETCALNGDKVCEAFEKLGQQIVM